MTVTGNGDERPLRVLAAAAGPVFYQTPLYQRLPLITLVASNHA